MTINLQTHQWAESKKINSNFYPETTSTNDIAKNEFPKIKEEFCLYLTDHQTRGRGRHQNTWQNMANGEILLSTWCFKTNKSPQPIFTPLLGLAVYSSLKKIKASLRLRLKAPNDILLNEGKLAGLLVEVSQQGHEFCLYIGLGLNVLGSPQIDIKTSQLFAEDNFQSDSWRLFCDSLLIGFQEAVIKGQRSNLSPTDQQALLLALNTNLPEEKKYLNVTPQCDLLTSQGVLPWADL